MVHGAQGVDGGAIAFIELPGSPGWLPRRRGSCAPRSALQRTDASPPLGAGPGREPRARAAAAPRAAPETGERQDRAPAGRGGPRARPRLYGNGPHLA